MSLLDDIKAKADANGDGKLTKDDLEVLKDQLPADKIDELKAKADANGDGKVSFDDVKSVDLGGMLDDAKGAIGGLFK